MTYVFKYVVTAYEERLGVYPSSIVTLGEHSRRDSSPGSCMLVVDQRRRDSNALTTGNMK